MRQFHYKKCSFGIEMQFQYRNAVSVQKCSFSIAMQFLYRNTSDTKCGFSNNSKGYNNLFSIRFWLSNYL